jgi:hypothetical protein
MSNHATQRERVLNTLRSANGAWVSILTFVNMGILRYGGRIHEIRKSGIAVESREERKGKSRHVFYRIPAEGQQKLF